MAPITFQVYFYTTFCLDIVVKRGRNNIFFSHTYQALRKSLLWRWVMVTKGQRSAQSLQRSHQSSDDWWYRKVYSTLYACKTKEITLTLLLRIKRPLQPLFLSTQLSCLRTLREKRLITNVNRSSNCLLMSVGDPLPTSQPPQHLKKEK